MQYKCASSKENHKRNVKPSHPCSQLHRSTLSCDYTLLDIVYCWYRKDHFQHILSDKFGSYTYSGFRQLQAVSTPNNVWPIFNSKPPLLSLTYADILLSSSLLHSCTMPIHTCLPLAYQPNYGAFCEAMSTSEHIFKSWNQIFLSHPVSWSVWPLVLFSSAGPTLPV